MAHLIIILLHRFHFFSDHQPCSRAQLVQIKANESARLLWQKRFHLVGRHRCQDHIIWEPQLLGTTPLLLTISEVSSF